MRLGCNSQGGSRGLDLSVARTVVQSLALSVALQNTEVFLMGQDCQRISTVLNDIYRNLLNVPKCTPLAGLFRVLVRTRLIPDPCPLCCPSFLGSPD